MEFTVELRQLAGAVESLSEKWPRQNNELDNATRFIYGIRTFDELIQSEEMSHLSDENKQYALHRWYNSKTSTVCERIFVEHGAVSASREENLHHTDVFINGMPFDVKLSVFPHNTTVRNMNLDLKRRADKNRLIQWFYGNQSSEQRNCFNNRLFVVCVGNDSTENSRLKQSFDQMDAKIQAYMDYLRQIDYAFNEVVVHSRDGQERTVKSDIITISQKGHDLKDRLLKERCPTCNGRYSLVVARLAAYRGNIIMKCPNCGRYVNV